MLTASLLVFAAALTTAADAFTTHRRKDTTEPTPPKVEHTINNSANGRCFLYVPKELSWVDAERNCQFLGGNLASVHSLDEYELIQDLIKNISGSDTRAWLGGSEGEEEGSWFWSDGSCFNFNYWSPEEPNKEKEECLEMNYVDKKKFNDRSCKDKMPSVCTIKPCDLVG